MDNSYYHFFCFTLQSSTIDNAPDPRPSHLPRSIDESMNVMFRKRERNPGEQRYPGDPVREPSPGGPGDGQRAPGGEVQEERERETQGRR
jgi:hypothetical protein